MRFTQSPSCPHIGMEVSGTWWEEEVTKFVPNNHFLQRIDVGVTVHSVVGSPHGLTTGVVSHSLKKNIDFKKFTLLIRKPFEL